jgi:hypothetical protein
MATQQYSHSSVDHVCIYIDSIQDDNPDEPDFKELHTSNQPYCSQGNYIQGENDLEANVEFVEYDNNTFIGRIIGFFTSNR